MPAGRFQAEAHAATIDLSKSKQNERSLKRLHLYRNQSSDNDARKSLRRGSEYHIKEQMIVSFLIALWRISNGVRPQKSTRLPSSKH